MSSDNQAFLGDATTAQLRRLALQAVEHAATGKGPLKLAQADLDAADELHHHRATFVTVYIDGALRGCLGSLEPINEVGEDVARNAYRAAQFDQRFLPVHADELDKLDVHISVLTPLEKLEVTGIDDLKQQVRPGQDGLLLKSGSRRGTFLPAVWEKTDGPEHFLQLLWRKAGFMPGEWPEDLQVFRYEAQEF